jgi:hypothetical protein
MKVKTLRVDWTSRERIFPYGLNADPSRLPSPSRPRFLDGRTKIPGRE